MTEVRRLKHVADVRFSSVDKKTVDGQIDVKLCNYTDVYYNERINPDVPFMDATATPGQIAAYTLRGGDVLLTKDSETADDIGVSAYVPRDLPGVLCGYHLAIARPRPSAIDGRYLRWALVSTASRQQLELAASGVTRFGLRLDAVGGMTIPVPSLREQVAIADYLDAETARIDGLLSLVGRLQAVAGVRVWERFVAATLSTRAPKVPLRRALRSLVDGPFGSAFTSDEYTDEGAFVVRLGNIGLARFHAEPAARIPMTLFQSFLQHRVEAGNLLIAALGDEGKHAGRACVAPNLGPAIVKGKCFCARVDETRADPCFLALYLSSSLGASAVGVESHGSGRMMINLEIAKAVPIVLPPLHVQVEIVEAVLAEQERADRISDLLLRQTELLNERRQALITAAVTGQLELAGAAA